MLAVPHTCRVNQDLIHASNSFWKGADLLYKHTWCPATWQEGLLQLLHATTASSSTQSTSLGSNPMGRAGVTETWAGPEKAHVPGELHEQEYRCVRTLGALEASLY